MRSSKFLIPKTPTWKLSATPLHMGRACAARGAAASARSNHLPKRKDAKMDREPTGEMNGGVVRHFRKNTSTPRTSDCIVIQVRLILSTAAVISFSTHQSGIISPYIAYVSLSLHINIYIYIILYEQVV